MKLYAIRDRKTGTLARLEIENEYEGYEAEYTVHFLKFPDETIWVTPELKIAQDVINGLHIGQISSATHPSFQYKKDKKDVEIVEFKLQCKDNQ